MHGTIDRDWTTEDLDLQEQLAQAESREAFIAYRRHLNPRMIAGWWQKLVAYELHRFWLQYQAGYRPKLLLQAPRQHGKSVMVTDFLSWIIGQNRDLKVIFSSFSDRLGLRANLRLQRIFASKRFLGVFGAPILQGTGMAQNSKLIEFGGGDGFFRNTTVGGSVTGEGLDVGVIDDPIKGRAEASSQLVRDKTWSWFTDDFLPCFADDGALLMIMTRWHIDDPAGRLEQQYPGVRVLRFPAIAEAEEKYRIGESTVGRHAGEPLFPELKTQDFLDKQRSIMTQAGWQSVYQQSPILVGGDMFPIEKVEIVGAPPASDQVVSVVRYWDKAGTSEGGAYSAGVLMARLKSGLFAVIDVRRGQWSALDRERMIRQTAEMDRELYPTMKIFLEQEPGSGGKESAEASVRMLAGFSAAADRVTGKKEVRADPFAAQWQAGNVQMVKANWNRGYLDEHEMFPAGKFKDQVDASTGAFNKIASKYRYDSTLSWVS
jgi:predicted phage terminase large subunit-like protein